MIHDLHPVPLERAGAGGARAGAAVHGVPRRQRRAAVARATASPGSGCEGSCSDCSASAVTLELAIKQALEQAAPDLDGLEVEGHRGGPPRRATAPVAARAGRSAAAPSWFEVDGSTAARRRRWPRPTSPAPRWWWPTSSGTLLAYRDRCAGCGGPLHGGELADGALRCPAASGRTSCPAPAARWTTTGCSSSRCRCCASRAPSRWRWRHERERRRQRRRGVRTARSPRPSPPAAGRRSSPACAGWPGRDRRRRRAAGARRRALRPLRHDRPGRPPPPAAAGRAADRVRVRELLGAALGRRRVPARPAAARCGCPRSTLPDDVWASFQIPIGLAFFMDSTTAGCVVALYPSPGGATESELHFASWSRMVELNPVLRGPRARHRGPDRQPPVRPAGVRDRPDRPLLRADRHDQGDLGGPLRRRRGCRRRSPRSSTSCRPRRSAA